VLVKLTLTMATMMVWMFDQFYASGCCAGWSSECVHAITHLISHVNT
jgi:hypothetical protein